MLNFVNWRGVVIETLTYYKSIQYCISKQGTYLQMRLFQDPLESPHCPFNFKDFYFRYMNFRLQGSVNTLSSDDTGSLHSYYFVSDLHY